MMKTSTRTPKTASKFQVEPLLGKVLHDARQEHNQLQQVFAMMGWGEIPDALKIEIKDDVKAMVDELNGHYSSCDPFVKNRRQRVSYWVENYINGICSAQTAIDALKVQKL